MHIVLEIIKLIATIQTKVVAIVKSGAAQEVLDDIHELINDVHGAVDVHHQTQCERHQMKEITMGFQARHPS